MNTRRDGKESLTKRFVWFLPAVILRPFFCPGFISSLSLQLPALPTLAAAECPRTRPAGARMTGTAFADELGTK